jgi:hypothetical protein
MPACGQCGKENPAGTTFCGHCGASLAAPAKPASRNPPAAPPSQAMHEVKAQPRPPRLEARIPPPPPINKNKGRIEWIAWSDLSAGQRLGRAGAILIAVFLVYFFLRAIVRDLVFRPGESQPAQVAETPQVPLTQGDRKDGVESLCKVFQIYGMPKKPDDAAQSAKNAAELFKLAGNQSHDRSVFILNALAREFQTGALRGSDCAQAGVPLGIAEPGDTPNPGPAR